MSLLKETLWSKLTDTAGTILEYVDITECNMELMKGEEFVTQLHIGNITQQVIDDILWYQTTKEGKGHYKASFDGNKLSIKFIKKAF